MPPFSEFEKPARIQEHASNLQLHHLLSRICSAPDYRTSVSYFIDYYKAHKKDLPITLWRDSPVQHFQTETGDYQWPIPGDSCAMIQGLELRLDNSLHALVSSPQIQVSKAENHTSLSKSCEDQSYMICRLRSSHGIGFQNVERILHNVANLMEQATCAYGALAGCIPMYT